MCSCESIPRDPNYLYLVAVGPAGGKRGKDQILASEDPANYDGPQGLYDALLPPYRAAFESFPRGTCTILASLENKDMTYDLSTKGVSLMDVCRAAYASSDDSNDDDSEKEEQDDNDPNFVCLETMVSDKPLTFAKVDPGRFNGAEALEAEVLSLCEDGYKEYGQVFVTLLKKGKMFKFGNDYSSRALVKEMCNSAYP